MERTPTSANPRHKINVGGNWLLSLTLTAVLWFARLSILCSIVRIANPTPFLRRIAYGVGILFLATEIGLLAQKVLICLNNHCWFALSIAVAQLVTDIFSDFILVTAPIHFLRGVKLARDRRLLILSAFSASILITCVTILHSILLFEATTNLTLIIGHVKAALALFLCNALFLVTFVYRLCQKGGIADPPHGTSNDVELTSVIELPSKLSMPTYPSGAPNKEDAASFTKAQAQNKSEGSELDPLASHTGKGV
ncbi:hypothetical protein JVU11DRAFT_8675 [Chiua virens]|nr:hypothetical protein JVU11DRAFT_8675 [Chiua virens]